MLGVCQPSSTVGSGCPLGQHIPQREAGGLLRTTFLPLQLLSILLCQRGGAKAKVRKPKKSLSLLGFIVHPGSVQRVGCRWWLLHSLPSLLSPVSSPNPPGLGGLSFRLFASFSTSYCPSRLGTHFTDQTASTLWRKVPLSPADSVLHMFEDNI